MKSVRTLVFGVSASVLLLSGCGKKYETCDIGIEIETMHIELVSRRLQEHTKQVFQEYMYMLDSNLLAVRLHW